MAVIDRSKVEALLFARLQAQAASGIPGLGVSTMGMPDRAIASGGRQVRIMSATVVAKPRCGSGGAEVGMLTLIMQVSASEKDAATNLYTATGDAQRVMAAMTHAAIIDTGVGGSGHEIHLGGGSMEEASVQGGPDGATPRMRAHIVTVEGMVVRASGTTVLVDPPG